MELTQPFINDIAGFDAKKGTTATINVSGGEKITSFTYSIYLKDGSTPISLDKYGRTEMSQSVQGDIASDTIRSFYFQIPSGILENSKTYKIIAYTSNGLNKSQNSAAQFFTCYETPTISIKYDDGTSYKNLVSGTTLKSTEAKIQVSLAGVEPYTNLRYGRINLYGINSNSSKELVFETNNFYSLDGVYTLRNFYSTNAGLFTSYSVEVFATMTDGLEISKEITGILCEYQIADETSSLLKVSNECKSGLINILVDLSSVSSAYEHISISYKEKGEIEWITIQNVSSSEMGDNKQLTFDFSYCGNNRIYDFKLDVYATNGTILIEETKTVLSQFNNNYICDNNLIYDITNENKINSAQLTSKNSFYEPYASKYPMISRNAITEYREGQTTAVLLAKTSLSMIDANIDRFAQVKLVREFNNWLSNGRAKIIKDFNGDLIFVAVVDAVTNDYYKELGNGIASTSFSWKEIGDFNNKDFNKLGMINNFNINYIN